MSSETPELTPAQEEEVRRQLAAARHDEPVPEAVVQRLDRVLAGLADERVPTPVGDPVVDLASRRRRRRATQLLVAAVAIVAVGFGFGELTGSMGGSGDDSASTADSGFERGDNSAGGDGELASPGSGQDEPGSRDYSELSSEVLGAEATKLRSTLLDTPAPEDDLTYLKATKATACVTPTTGETAVAVEFDSALATLVYRVPVADRQRVDLYRCNPRVRLRSVTIPGP